MWMIGSTTMATTTTTRLRAVGTCSEVASSSLEGKTLPLQSSSLRNGLTSLDVEDTVKINGYTLTSNGHVHVSKRCNEPACYTIPSVTTSSGLMFAASHGVRDVQSRRVTLFGHSVTRTVIINVSSYIHSPFFFFSSRDIILIAMR